MASYNDYFAGVLRDLGAPVTAPNLNFLAGWAQVEGTAAANNPLATTLHLRGSSPLPGNSAGVQQYPSVQEGERATAQTLSAGYPNIVSALKTGNILEVSFQNPPGLIAEFAKWSGHAGDTAPGGAGYGYFQAVKLHAQGNPGGKSASDIGSYDLGNAVHDVTSPFTGWVKQLVDFIKAYTLRLGEVVGGGLLVLAGLLILTRGSVPVPTPAGVV